MDPLAGFWNQVADLFLQCFGKHVIDLMTATFQAPITFLILLLAGYVFYRRRSSRLQRLSKRLLLNVLHKDPFLRDDIVQEVVNALKSRTRRPIVLYGPAGSGKTHVVASAVRIIGQERGMGIFGHVLSYVFDPIQVLLINVNAHTTSVNAMISDAIWSPFALRAVIVDIPEDTEPQEINAIARGLVCAVEVTVVFVLRGALAAFNRLPALAAAKFVEVPMPYHAPAYQMYTAQRGYRQEPPLGMASLERTPTPPSAE